MLFLYADTFDPAVPLSNGVASDDDSGPRSDALVATNLTAGTRYTAVLTSFGNGNLGNFTLTVNGPGAISVSAVPEPAAWGLMILGFGAVGTSLRRRGKVVARVRFA